MVYFDLIFEECLKLNNILDQDFCANELFFINANISEISYGLDGNKILFCYYPERYEYGKVMLLKDLAIQISHDKKRQYSIRELCSFFQNDCKHYQVLTQYKTLDELVFDLKYVLHQFACDKNNEWEIKFTFLKDSNLPKW